MFTLSVVDAVSGAFRFGLVGPARFDPDPLGDFAIRAIPLAGSGVDPADVAEVEFVLRDGSGDIIAEASDAAAPFDFIGQDATVLAALASGDYTLTATARDASGGVLGAPTEQEFTLGADDTSFTGFRVQAEETTDGDLSGDGNVDSAPDGNFATLNHSAGATNPIIKARG